MNGYILHSDMDMEMGNFLIFCLMICMIGIYFLSILGSAIQGLFITMLHKQVKLVLLNSEIVQSDKMY